MKCPECGSIRVHQVLDKSTPMSHQLGQFAPRNYPKVWQCGEANCQHRWPIEPKPKVTPAPQVQQADNEEETED